METVRVLGQKGGHEDFQHEAYSPITFDIKIRIPEGCLPSRKH